jgi:hypothetical protein
MRRHARLPGVGVSRRLRELFGATSRLTFGFDEPWEDPLTPEEWVDEAIEQLYGARHQGRRSPGDDPSDRPGREGRFRIRRSSWTARPTPGGLFGGGSGAELERDAAHGPRAGTGRRLLARGSGPGRMRRPRTALDPWALPTAAKRARPGTRGTFEELS